MSKFSIKIFFGVLGVVLALVISNLTPPEGLTPKAMTAVGIFICAIVFWMAEVIPDYITSILLPTTWVLFKAVPFGTAFGAFNTSSFWLILGALGLATAVGKSGLLTRITLAVMSIFPLNYKSQTLGLMVASTIINPLIPSGTTKTALMAPLAQAMSDTMGYERKSAGAGGMFGAMFISIGCMHCVMLSGSFACYLILGLLPEPFRSEINWGIWLRNAAPFGITVLVMCYLFIQFAYRPTGKSAITADMIKKQREALGSMSRNEKIVAAVLVCCIILWITEKIHGINSSVVALAAFSVICIANVLTRTDFRASITWDALIFIGGILCVASVFPALGIDKWLGSQLGPFVVPIIKKSFALFLVVYAVGIILLRYIIVSQTAFITIATILMIPFAVEAGINPWIVGFTAFACNTVWNTKYMNATFLTSFYAAQSSGGGNDLVTYKQMAKLAYFHSLTIIIGLLVSIPFWKMFGMLG